MKLCGCGENAVKLELITTEFGVVLTVVAVDDTGRRKNGDGIVIVRNNGTLFLPENPDKSGLKKLGFQTDEKGRVKIESR